MLLFFLLSCAKEAASKSQHSDSRLCARAFIWFVPVSGARVCALLSLCGKLVASSAAGSLWLYWQSPLSLPAVRYRRETHVHTAAHTRVYSAPAWRPLEHCVDRLCAMSG